MQFNKICYNFQKQFIDTFNGEENIPFLLKYYLFKQVWEKVEQNKFLIDRDVRLGERKYEEFSGSFDDSSQENESEEAIKNEEK